MKMPSEEDYKIAICNPQLIKCPLLAGGNVYKDERRDVPYMWSGGFCVVFKYSLANGRDCAVRCWKADIDSSMQRTQRIAEALNELTLPYFVNFEYHVDAIAAGSAKHPIVIMDWVAAKSLKPYLEANLQNPSALAALAENFKKMVSDLHANNLSHGDLQHENIMVKDDGGIKLIDYDSMFVPGMESFKDEIKGLDGYQHPGRKKFDRLSPKSDYFSELVIYAGILMLKAHPQLWDDLNISDTDTFVLRKEDVDNPDSSDILRMMCSDSDIEISTAGQAIRDALSKNSIDELLPLEAVFKGRSSSILDKINAFQPKATPVEPYSKKNLNSILNKINSMSR